MRVRVLYFGGTRDAVGVGEESRELPVDVRTIADFTRHVAEIHPTLASRIATVRIARNEQFADPVESISEGDVLALLPPVSGG